MEESRHYKAWLDEEERKLRWLIARQPGSVELRYYLVFLLLANEQCAKALKECKHILAIDPDNLIARWWIDEFHEERLPGLLRRSYRRWRGLAQGRSWNQSGCGDH
jgi:hypothetical protein